MSRKADGRGGRRMTRRQLLATTGAGAAGAAALTLAPWEAGVAPAQIKGTSLRILVWSHFVPQYDTAFDKYVSDWGKRNGVDARVDHINENDLPTRIASESSAGAGHDIVQMVGIILTTAYYPRFVDLTDLCEKLGKQHGGWLPIGPNVAVVNGRWYGMPEFFIPQPVLWRTDLFKQYGLPAPNTWDDMLHAAAVGKPKGHPAGFAISHCNDSNHNWRAVFYAFGVEEQDPTGKEIRWDSPELREAMKFSRDLWSRGMTSEVFAWDDVSDNRYLDSGVAIYTHDAISAIRSIQKSNPTLYSEVNIAIPNLEPMGPKMRAPVVDPTMMSIWSFSKNISAAKAFLEEYGADYKWSLNASLGYNMPFLRNGWVGPMPGLSDDPKTKLLTGWDKVALVFGHPGPANAPAAEVLAQFVVPDMVARYCHSNDLEGSIKWGLGQIKDIYANYQKYVVLPYKPISCPASNPSCGSK
jgi:multiple sugar transport system substrate-binding protein